MKKADKPYHHGNLAEALLDAVDDLANRFGLEAVSLRACAKQIGVSPSSAFRHYPDKRALMTAFATRAMARLSEALTAAAERDGALESVALAYVGYALDHPALFRAMWREDTIYLDDPAWRAMAARLTRQLAGGFGEALADEDPESLSDQELLLWSTLHGLAVLFIDGPLAGGGDRPARLAQAERVVVALRPVLTLRQPG